jgi:hypothetical protein
MHNVDIQRCDTYLTIGWPICKWDEDADRACRSRTAFLRERKQALTSLRNISCLTKVDFSQFCAMSVYMLAFIHTAGYAYLPGRVTYAYKTYRATPTIKLLESRSARGSAGSVMRPQSWMMSAPMTSRFGSLLNEDLAPRVAASLQMALSTTVQGQKNVDLLP